LGDTYLQADVLSLQTVGGVALAAYNTDVDIVCAELICRDTIEWD